ncbi:hypothetical protein DFH09DRAFT_1081102 [Mycena vulgaris]|nr:hypothetical protein DFH09DRAFT_1081102 [Mycena vulgaris]
MQQEVPAAGLEDSLDLHQFNVQGWKHLLQSYKWSSPNSCFFDNGLEHCPDSSIAGKSDLELCQRVVRHAIFKKWGLYAREDEYGCPKTWMHHTITGCSFTPGIPRINIYTYLQEAGMMEEVHLYFRALRQEGLHPIDPQAAVIETRWPEILQITPEAYHAACLPNSHVISLPAEDGLVEYSLVSTIVYRSKYWTSKIRIGDETFFYDDL